ncbi:ATP-binding protein [Actinacidiphila acidipaludis]|uniref:ATP-binding protein n=1 Tax=Actinacidiphila acidipaludis TaxID=2873382 RepID=A0ABS7Q4J2_9ACTN|nr:ATP-binding protein [Streptomyces acidipaludis]MBY8878079.1 ATP-binding protein [Streptomyces acidipaludis]
MDIDTTQPWGVAIDYAGRATVTDSGHTVFLRIYDNSLDPVAEPDSLTGQYPPVYVTAQISEDGDLGSQVRGFGQIVVPPTGTDPVTPDQRAAQSAVAAAVADFDARVAAYAALCTQWTATPPTGG